MGGGGDQHLAHDAGQDRLIAGRGDEGAVLQQEEIGDGGAGGFAIGVEHQRVIGAARRGLACRHDVVDIGNGLEAAGGRGRIAADGAGDETCLLEHQLRIEGIEAQQQ